MNNQNTSSSRRRLPPDDSLQAIAACADSSMERNPDGMADLSAEADLWQKLVRYETVQQPWVNLVLIVWGACLLCAPSAFAASFKYSATVNKIYVYGTGSATLSNIKTALPSAPLSVVDSANKIWLLSANLIVQDGCTLVLNGGATGDVNQLRLLSLNTGVSNTIVYIQADWGILDINNTKITSWNTNANGPSTNIQSFGRSYIYARSSLSTNGVTPWSSQMNITNSEICFLGDTNSNEQGLLWKVSGVDPNPTNNPHGVQVFGNVINSQLHDNYIGAYTFGGLNMRWLTNRIYNSAQYGLDLQNYSDNTLIMGNTFSNNQADPFLLSDCYSNIVATNIFSYSNGKLRFEGGKSNWMDGNSITNTMSLSVASDTSGPGSVYVRNETTLKVDLDTNSSATFVDAQGRIYKPDENVITTAISTSGSVLTLTPAGIGSSTTVVVRDLYAGVTSGTAHLDHLTWNPPAGVQWTFTAGSIGQAMNFTVKDLTNNMSYAISRGSFTFTNVTTDATGQLRFFDTATTTSSVVYEVGTANTNQNNSPYQYDAALNKIYVQNGVTATLSTIQAALPTAPLTLVDINNKIWLLSANLVVQDGSTLVLHGASTGGDVNQLRLLSLNTGASNSIVYLAADPGHLDINGTKITSWDTNANGPDSNYLTYGRAYILARSTLAGDGVTPLNSRMDITNSELCFLGGSTNSDQYGVVWKVSGIDPNPAINIHGVQVYGNVYGSRLHDNYMGAYTLGALNMLWLGNQVDNNAKYGLDMQDYSDNALLQGNTFSNNQAEAFLLSDCFNNTLATNTIIDLTGTLRFESGGSNWLNGNIIPAGMVVSAVSDTNGPGSLNVRNQPFLNVAVDTNSTVTFVDALGRIYQPTESTILTAVSANGSVLTLTPAGIGSSTAVSARDFFATAAPGTGYLSQLVWNPPGNVQWTMMAGSTGQALTFTVDDLTVGTSYSVSRGMVVIANITANASGQIQFTDTPGTINPVVYSVTAGSSTRANLSLQKFTNGLAISWTGGSGTLQSTTNLLSPNWQNVLTTNGPVLINPGMPRQFFRIVQ
jgi:parallel beta-helix repeat protein